MSDVAWARVERGLWARIDSATTLQHVAPRRSRLWLAAPFAAVLAAAAALVIVLRNTPHDSAPIPADEPTRIVAGDAPSSMSFGDVHVELDAHAAIVMETGATPSARGERAPFVVLAGDTRVRVVGTRFRVARSGELSQVSVEHGLVEITFHGNVARIAAHQTWSSDRPATVTAVVAQAEPPAATMALPQPPPAPVAHAAKHHDVVDADAARYQALVKLEASQPGVAMKGYLDLSQGAGRWAEVALFAAGRLAADRHDPRAESLLAIYLRRFPTGANVADADRLLSRLKGEPR
jgi:hypothetical protein